MTSGQVRALPVGYWPAYIAAWLAVGAAYMTIFVLQGSPTGQAGVNVLNNTGSAAVLGVAVVWWTGYESGRNRRREASVFRAALLAVVFAGAWLLLIGVGFSIQAAFGAGSWVWRPLTGPAVPWQLFAGLMVFAAVAASGFAARAWGALRVEAERAARAEALRTRAELESLRARLHPHFLFNTLHSVRSQVLYDPDAAATSLDEFAGLLRYALKVNRDGIGDALLDEEWAETQRYISLERLRLGDRLQVRANLSPASLKCRVPTFLLQPLIENAIRYAVAPRREGGTIQVHAGVENGSVEIMVADDGPGARVEDLDEAGGLGLRALRERLEVLYPGKATLAVVTAPDQGFQVRVRVPTSTGAFD